MPQWLDDDYVKEAFPDPKAQIDPFSRTHFACHVRGYTDPLRVCASFYMFIGFYIMYECVCVGVACFPE